MVRDPLFRKKKYEAKIDGDVIRSRILAQKADMVAQQESAQADLAAIEVKVKSIVENSTVSGKPIPTYMIPPYLNCGRQLYRASLKFSGNTLELKAKTICDAWVAQGLDGTVVSKIAELFGLSYTPPGP